jgi:LemA protein
MIPIAVIAVFVVILLVWAVSIYNGLVSLRNRFKNAFAQIDVQLKRRYDLIPNLVETAKGYLAHERRWQSRPGAWGRNGHEAALER